MKKVLVVIADGFEELEAVSIVDICRRGGLEVTVCSTNSIDVVGARDIVLKADILISQIDSIDFYSAIILPGGDVNARTLKKNKIVQSIIKEFKVRDKFICAICASPIALSEAGVIDGEFTCYPNYNSEINSGDFIEQDVVKSDKLITSRGPATASDFAFEIVSSLHSKQKSKEIQKAMLYSK
jgi:4-methyl-5(b-hydroxyethyl)-thiazole monophosphate biosynthesis